MNRIETSNEEIETDKLKRSVCSVFNYKGYETCYKVENEDNRSLYATYDSRAVIEFLNNKETVERIIKENVNITNMNSYTFFKKATQKLIKCNSEIAENYSKYAAEYKKTFNNKNVMIPWTENFYISSMPFSVFFKFDKKILEMKAYNVNEYYMMVELKGENFRIYSIEKNLKNPKNEALNSDTLKLAGKYMKSERIEDDVF